jgi:hypothetical protein
MVATGDHDQLLRVERALDPQTTNEGGGVTCAAAPQFEGLSGGAQPMRRHHVAEPWSRFGQQQPEAAPGAAVADPITLDEHRTQPGNRAGLRNRAAGQPTAHDDDVGSKIASTPREIRSAGSRKLMDPGRQAVTCTHAMQNSKAKVESAKCEHRLHCLFVSCILPFCILHYLASFSSSFFLRATPHRYPARLPSLPTTR